MTPRIRGPCYAHCTICAFDLNIAGGGFCEIKRHIETRRHKDGVRSVTIQPTMPSLHFELQSTSGHSLKYQITTAELCFATFVVEYNISFSTGDHLTKLCKR